MQKKLDYESRLFSVEVARSRLLIRTVVGAHCRTGKMREYPLIVDLGVSAFRMIAYKYRKPRYNVEAFEWWAVLGLNQ